MLDAILDRPEVDDDRVAVAGQSLGGYFVPRAAAYDRRIKAAIGNGVIYDLPAVMNQHLDNLVANSARRDVPLERWEWNVDSPQGFRDAQYAYKYDPALLDCPVLSVIGEGEYQNRELQRQTETVLKLAKDKRSARSYRRLTRAVRTTAPGRTPTLPPGLLLTGLMSCLSGYYPALVGPVIAPSYIIFTCKGYS